jgi:hypothetical protein
LTRVAESAVSFRERSRAPSVFEVVTIAIGVALVVLATAVMPAPGYVDRISFVNATSYDVSVDVSSSPTSSTMQVTNARHKATTVQGQVVDQGEQWVFHLATQGRAVGTLPMSRSELERAGWRVVIPQRIEAELQRVHVPPSP